MSAAGPRAREHVDERPDAVTAPGRSACAAGADLDRVVSGPGYVPVVVAVSGAPTARPWRSQDAPVDSLRAP
ncbi:hypothetical protein GCM10012276_26090 [Nocardioides deserti]|nr:hypothetical protein GCM10012276_26090 [Nocardioides deserti]